MRSFIVLLLCLALGLYGSAGANAFEPPCPMESGTSAMEMDTPLSAADCCTDADTVDHGGDPCKIGQACKLPNSSAIMSVQAAVFSPMSSRLALIALSAVPSFQFADIWRPPSFS
ncbi:MAG: hypothetical protein LPJ87_08405 [Zoogloeaceae bacterium]|nr:hypothetical protein [Zoogloeaceae bacterium]